MNTTNTKIKITISYSKDEMDNFNDGRKINFIVEIPMKNINDKNKLAQNISDFCQETSRNLLIANEIKFREYITRVEFLK